MSALRSGAHIPELIEGDKSIMKNYGNNKAILEDVVVRYDPMLDSISLTTKDPDLKGKMFSIALSNGTSSYNALKTALMSMGVIDEKQQIPDHVSYEGINENSDPTMIPLGAGSGGSPVFWNIESSPVLRVYGYAGAGKTTMINIALDYIKHFPDEWEAFRLFHNFDPTPIQFRRDSDPQEQSAQMLRRFKNDILSLDFSKKVLIVVDDLENVISSLGRENVIEMIAFIDDLARSGKVSLMVSMNTAVVPTSDHLFSHSSDDVNAYSDTVVSIGDINYSRILFNKSFQRQNRHVRGVESVAFIKEGQGDLHIFRTFASNASILDLPSK